jgi:hypothetical protein
MDEATPADGAAAALGKTISNLERAALDSGSVAVEIRGRQVRAIAHAQTRGSRTVRRVCWELDGGGISRANLLAALTRAGSGQ